MALCCVVVVSDVVLFMLGAAFKISILNVVMLSTVVTFMLGAAIKPGMLNVVMLSVVASKRNAQVMLRLFQQFIETYTSIFSTAN